MLTCFDTKIATIRDKRVPLLLHALPHELFLSALKAGVTSDSDINYCCEILSQLAIDQRERSLAREFFHRHQKTNDLNQLVKAATKVRQELPLTSAPQTSHRRPNQPRPRWIPSRQTPRAGKTYFSLSCQPPNAPRPFLQALGKLEGCPCRFLLDSGAVKSLVNPEAFPDPFRKFRARSSSIKLLSAEGRKMKAIGETSLKITIGKESWTLQFVMCPELVCDAILGVDFRRKTGAILNFAEGTFTTQQHKAIKSVEPSLEKSADEICSALFEAADRSVGGPESAPNSFVILRTPLWAPRRCVSAPSKLNYVFKLVSGSNGIMPADYLVWRESERDCGPGRTISKVPASSISLPSSTQYDYEEGSGHIRPDQPSEICSTSLSECDSYEEPLKRETPMHDK
ncbi:unnamed protein product, partial [Taenia asiatica]|uniref:RVP domain-containing protein n=1 Tax=Taenia asiatica TaxID=60517 RepID=A0A0R3WGP8_TAEAS